MCVVVVRAPSRLDRASTSSSRACRASTRPSTRRPWTARRSCTPRAASAHFTRCGVDLGPRVALCRSFVRSGGGVERSLSRPAGGTLVGSRPARSRDRAALFAAAAAAFLPLPRRPLSRATLTRLNLLSPSDARDDDGRAVDGRRRAPPGIVIPPSPLLTSPPPGRGAAHDARLLRGRDHHVALWRGRQVPRLGLEDRVERALKRRRRGKRRRRVAQSRALRVAHVRFYLPTTRACQRSARLSGCSLIRPFAQRSLGVWFPARSRALPWGRNAQ